MNISRLVDLILQNYTDNSMSLLSVYITSGLDPDGPVRDNKDIIGWSMQYMQCENVDIGGTTKQSITFKYVHSKF